MNKDSLEILELLRFEVSKYTNHGPLSAEHLYEIISTVIYNIKNPEEENR